MLGQCQVRCNTLSAIEIWDLGCGEGIKGILPVNLVISPQSNSTLRFLVKRQSFAVQPAEGAFKAKSGAEISKTTVTKGKCYCGNCTRMFGAAQP